MMFNWNDQDQVEGILWPDLIESKDHIVPHPMETEEATSLPAGDCRKDRKDQSDCMGVMSTDQSSQSNNDYLSYKSESSSGLHTNGELTSSGLEMETWLDFPNLPVELDGDYADVNNQNSVTELMNDLTGATTVNSVTGDSMQLDDVSNLFGREDKVDGDFLDCDWATFGDFDDIEKFFKKNGPVFGHDMIGDAECFLSSSKDVIESSVQSIPMPDLPSCKNQTTDEDSSFLQLDDQSDKHASLLQKEQVDSQKVTLRSQNKAEETKKNKQSRDLKENYQNQHSPSTNLHSSLVTGLPNSQSKTISQQMQSGEARPALPHGSSNHVAFAQHGHPMYWFPGMPFPPQVLIDRSHKRPVPLSSEVHGNDPKYPKTSNLPDAKPTNMTPQKKMEKLRRLQQIQAQLAIEQQHQRYSNQMAAANVPGSQSNSQSTESIVGRDESTHKVPSSGLNMVAEHEDPNMTSSLTYDPPVEETIYYQLQDVVEKLDVKIRLGIRDSLFRLARSAMERQCPSDRSSATIGHKDEDETSVDESRNNDRSIRLVDSETGTNPIDRVVANLLFQSPRESSARVGSHELLSPT